MIDINISQVSKKQMWCRFYRSWIASTIAGCGVGAFLGWILQIVSNLDSLSLSIIIGGVVGGVIAGALYLKRQHRSSFALETVTVSVPHFTDMVFVVNNEYRTVAWKLFVETMTRVSTQPLDPQGGHLREALDSLYQLFQSTRALLENMTPTQSNKGTTVELLAIRMLNVELRPYLTKWHPRIPRVVDTSTKIDEDGDCREELEKLRNALLSYSKAFGELANVRQLDRFYNSDD